MQLVLKDNLPFTSVVIGYRGSDVEVTNVLIDTGSASSIFAADIVEHIQIVPSPQDILQVIRGIGGTEVVFKRRVDFLKLGEFRLPNFEIEVGGMDYGFKIHGILGMDFLISSGAIINLKSMQIQFEH
jgi:hypothetical protein